MPTIAISSFLGENRAAEPKLIPDGQGTVSLNQKPGRGDLRPWREPTQVFTAPGGTKPTCWTWFFTLTVRPKTFRR